ncbi:MAG: hypothetical protein KBB55_01500 [Candidatus Buchananbacteria bacterium]|nr:hypothetical protein [Candidatus Buchananbacteria bacterium]
MEVTILNDRNILTGIEFYSRYLRSDLLYRNQYIAAAYQRLEANKTNSSLVYKQCEETAHLAKLFSRDEWPGLYALLVRLNDTLGPLVISEIAKRNVR